MREILFRGKRTDNGEWVKGFPYITHGGEHQIRYYDSESNIENCSHTVIPDTLGRFTGLTDRNGVKIFEGDIVLHKGECGLVGYSYDYGMFEVDFDFVYKASSPNYPVDIGVGANGWRPSIHMPKEAARIFLRVTDVRVERLQDINTGGIRNEGLTSMAVHAGDMEIAQAEFALLWDTTVKESELEDYGWAANPWVWVIEFERLEVSEND